MSTRRTGQRNQLEEMLAEIRRIIREQEEKLARAAIEGVSDSRMETQRRCLERQRAIEAYLQADFNALVMSSPLAAAMGAEAPATEHHGPEY